MNEPGQSIRLGDWLDLRRPRPPAALSARLAELTAGVACGDRSEIPPLLIGRACEILSSIGSDRAAATDLLAADALITYAMEAAAESSSVDVVAAMAMRAIADTSR